MKQMHVVIVVDRYWPSRGGVEQAAASLASSFPEEWNIRIITHRPATIAGMYAMFTAKTILPEKDPGDRTIEPLDTGRIGKLLLLPLLIWELPLLRKRNPRLLYDLLYLWYKQAFFSRLEALLAGADSVHCISTRYLGRCVSDVCLKNGIPFIHQPFIHFGRWGDSPVQMRAYAAADVVLCPTESFKTKFLERLEAGFDASVKVLPPVIVEQHYPTIQVAPVPGRFILFLGRREAHKGLTELLVAFNGLEHIASLVIAGPGKEISVRNIAVFDLGEVDDKIKIWLLSRCDILCVPSSDESFGIVFAEAMSYGKPIVAFDVEPINEIVQNGVNALLVPPDDTESLHKALENLLTNENLLQKMGEASKQRFDKLFKSKVVIEKVIELHTSLWTKTATAVQEEEVSFLVADAITSERPRAGGRVTPTLRR